MTTTTQQTVTIGGKRIRLVTRDGKVTAKPAPVLEWLLQAAAVRSLRGLPEYARTACDARPGSFTLAGDFNAARRSMQESAKAKATGLTSGEHDLRLYLWPASARTGGTLGLVEFKAANGRLSTEQRDRHALLAALGFTRQAVVRAVSEDDAAAQSVALVRGWLADAPTAGAANDNNCEKAKKIA